MYVTSPTLGPLMSRLNKPLTTKPEKAQKRNLTKIGLYTSITCQINRYNGYFNMQ